MVNNLFVSFFDIMRIFDSVEPESDFVHEILYILNYK